MHQFLLQRDRRPERMDDPEIDQREHARALRGLARLNRLSMIERTVWRVIQQFTQTGSVRVLDLAAGSGDLVVALAIKARKKGLPIRFAASDISAFACDQIRRRAEVRGLDIEVVCLDVLAEEIPRGYDVVMCHLFLHHLDDPNIITLLGKMQNAAKTAVCVTDLVRSRTGYLLASMASRMVTRSAVVHTDALLSVRAAMTPGELAGLASRAGMADARIRRIWPERMLLTCRV
ncbi:MAG TPA: methyltransferase domain-containing protein [Phycisphaerales bacterium]|nr:methyltransferase domain-containing protein [Phycisphaerales bacterium]